MAGEEINPFSAVETEGQSLDPFALVNLEPAPPANARNITTQMVALSSDPSARILGLQQDSIDKAQQLLDNGQEYALRNKIALDRATQQMTSLEKQRTALETNPVHYDQNVIDSINKQTTLLREQQIEDSQRTALELETIDRINDLSISDPTQAQVLYDLYKNGNAQRVMHDNLAKSMVMSQRMEELQADYGEHSWAKDLMYGVVNLTNPLAQISSTLGVTPGPNPFQFALEFLTPLRSNFARSGILDDAGVSNNATSVYNWVFSGTGLEAQSNALWKLPLNEFAAAMDRNGPVMSSIKSNATLLGQYSQMTAVDVLRSLNFQSENDKMWANAWGVADPVLLLPVGKVLSVPKMMLRAGARREAAQQVARAVETLATDGAEAVSKNAAMKPAEAVEAIEMSAFNPNASTPNSVTLAQDVITHEAATKAMTAEMSDIIQRSARWNTDEELQAAYQTGLEEFKQQFGKQVSDVRPMYEETLTGAAKPFEGVVPQQGGVVHFWDVTFGKKTGGGWAKESTAQRNALNSNRHDAEVFRADDGQWYYRSRFNMQETQFYTELLETPAQRGPLSYIRSSARTLDPTAHAKVLADEASSRKVVKTIHDKISTVMKGLNKDESIYLGEILKKGQNQARWFGDREFDMIYERATGKAPSASVKHAYNSYQVLNNFDHAWRNSLLYEKKVLAGGESVQFRMGEQGDLVSRDAVVIDDPRLRPRGDVFDASTGSYISNVTASRMQEYADKGYALVKLMDNIDLPNKTQVKYVMVKKSDLTRGPLQRDQLGYTAGGHRSYTGNIFAKQTATDGQNRLINPNVYITGSNPNVMQDWADTMNAAIKATRGGVIDTPTKPSITYSTTKIQRDLKAAGGDTAKLETLLRSEIKTALDEGADVYILSKGKRVPISMARDFRLSDVLAANGTKGGKSLKFDYQQTSVKDPAWLDNNIFKGQKQFPTGEEFLKMIDEGKINTKYDIVVTRDREMPKEYIFGKGHPDLELVDDFEEPVRGYYRTVGQMYYSPKGKPLKDYTGEFAETVDPWESLNSGLANLSRTSTLANYRESTVERFRNTWGEFLDLPNVASATPWELAQAPIKAAVKDTNPEMRAAIAKTKQEQQAMRTVLSFETDFDRNVRHLGQAASDWVMGDSKGLIRTLDDGTQIYERSNREVVANWVDAFATRRPFDGIRGFAFDLKLGLFNASQLFIQSATMLSATALSPRNGLKGMLGAVPLVTYARAGVSKEAVLDVFAKRGVWKAAGFESADEFKDFARFMNESGMMDIGNHLNINDIGANAVTGAKAKIQNFRETARLFFYMPEQLNRMTAGRIAWEELKGANVARNSAKFREQMIKLTDDYSFNMMNGSAAQFQRGFMSIPTQFWGYNVRMMDAMFGNRFTLNQKLRLGIASMLFAGSAGVTGVDGVMEFIKQSNPRIAEGFTDPQGDATMFEKIAGNVDRGIVDAFIYNTVGADVNVGEKLGTGGWLTTLFKDLYGISEYGPKSAAEMLTGPTGSTLWSASETFANVVKWAAAESGGEGYPITKDTINKLAMEISTWSNTSKAIMALNYGYYVSKSGAVTADLPTQTAFFLALGFQPGQAQLDGYKAAYLKDKNDMISDASKQIRNWRQEAAHNPDKRDENMAKVNTLVRMLPVDIKDQVLRKSKSDDTFHEYIAKKYEEEIAREQFIRRDEQQ